MKPQPNMSGATLQTRPAALAERHAIAARIERLPPCSALRKIVLMIAIGGWFEFYELFMPGGIAPGLVKDGIYTLRGSGVFDLASFPSFLAAFFLGMFISTLLFTRLSDVLGRRFIFIWAMVTYSVCNVLIAVSSSPGWIDLFRLGAGLGVGTQLINNDSFLAELLPRQFRGRYMALAMAFILSATPSSVLIGTLFTPYAPLGISGWRWVVMVGALGGLIVYFIQRGVPESPRWLESKGRLDEADIAMRRIEDAVERDRGPLPPLVAALPEPPVKRGDWREIFNRFYLPRTFAMAVVPVLPDHRGVRLRVLGAGDPGRAWLQRGAFAGLHHGDFAVRPTGRRAGHGVRRTVRAEMAVGGHGFGHRHLRLRLRLRAKPAADAAERRSDDIVQQLADRGVPSLRRGAIPHPDPRPGDRVHLLLEPGEFDLRRLLGGSDFGHGRADRRVRDDQHRDAVHCRGPGAVRPAHERAAAGGRGAVGPGPVRNGRVWWFAAGPLQSGNVE